MSEIAAPIDQRAVQSKDGTMITYYVAGMGKNIWIIPPGLGTPLLSWKYLFEEFQDYYTFLTWDIRGTYNSETPADLENMRVENHIDDLEAIVKQEDFTLFILGGWSMGVQIALEYYHRHPEKVRALILLNGAYEKVLSTAFHIPAADAIFTTILNAGRAASPIINPVVTSLLSWNRAVEMLRYMNIVSENFEFFTQLVRQFSKMDWNVYFKLMLTTNEHSAAEYLKEVKVPTLITAGSMDAMTPVTTAMEMHRSICNSELFLVPNGTHYTICEYPEIINLRLEKFFRKIDPDIFNQSKK